MNAIPHYLALMRFEKPVGWFLLLWPTLWALWICYQGNPPSEYVWIFTVAVIVMRSAGCVINDYADRDIDPHVERTQARPLASGALTANQALGLFVILGLIAIVLLLQLPMRVWPWAIPAAGLTIIYPFMKRFIQAPQLVLSLAFSFGIPMVYVTAAQPFDAVFWMLFVANLLWVLAFDTAYAMSDREDDLKIGVKSSAIFFGRFDVFIIAFLQLAFVGLWLVIKHRLELHSSFHLAILIVVGLFVWQWSLIKDRERGPCFQAFVNNAWVGAVLWFGLLSAF